MSLEYPVKQQRAIQTHYLPGMFGEKHLKNVNMGHCLNYEEKPLHLLLPVRTLRPEQHSHVRFSDRRDLSQSVFGRKARKCLQLSAERNLGNRFLTP